MPASDLHKTPSRNAPCPCGSGKKFKRCCGAAANSHSSASQSASTDQLQQVIQYYQAGNFPGAAQLAERLLQSDPDNAVLIEITAATALQTGNAELAANRFKQQTLLQPDNALAHSNLCMTLHALGQDDAAFRSGQQATQLDPALADAWNNLGNIYKSSNNLEGALEHYEKALALNPEDPEVLVNTGAVSQLLGNTDSAEQLYRQAIQLSPHFAGAFNNLGTVLQIQGRFEEAEQAFKTALELQPTNPDVLTNLGSLMLDRKDTDSAEQYLQQAIDTDPKFTGAWINLGNLHDTLNDNEQSERYWQKALLLDPENSTVLCNIGIRLFGLGHQKDAVDHFVRALKRNPHSVKALAGLGNAMLREGKLETATQYIEKALKLAPWDIHAHIARANLLRNLHRTADAGEEWNYVTTHKPDLAEGHIGLAKHLSDLDMHEAARKQYQHAESLVSDCFSLYHAWSKMEERHHNLKDAEHLAEKAAALNPAYPGLVIIKARLARRNGDFQAALDWLRKIDRHAINDYQMLSDYLFEMGAVEDKLGHHPEAFSAFKGANDSKNLYAGYIHDAEEDEQEYSAIKRFFSKESMQQLASLADSVSDAAIHPVFIVGFPRSGTSLLEQILGSHSNISPAGELTGIHNISITRIGELTGSKLDYPHFLNDPDAPINTDVIEQLRNDYLALACSKCIMEESTVWVTDKMPHNAGHLGLIRVLFPKAPIIHIVRHPLNPCLSAFFSNFKIPHRYTCNLRSTALHYNQLMGVVSHYREIGIDFLEIKYEDLVNNQETITRQVLEYIGAPWDESVLQHHRNKRIVKTASYEQVTKKVYTSSLNRYQNYWDAVQEIIPILQPTIDRLGYKIEPPPPN